MITGGKTQCEQILDYISEFGSITSLEAITELGCLRLASRVSDLRKAGYNIEGKFETHTNQKGEKKRYVRYTIEPRGEANATRVQY